MTEAREEIIHIMANALLKCVEVADANGVTDEELKSIFGEVFNTKSMNVVSKDKEVCLSEYPHGGDMGLTFCRREVDHYRQHANGSKNIWWRK